MRIAAALPLALVGATAAAGLFLAGPWLYLPAMPFLPLPSPAAEREHEQARWHPERDTLLLAAAGAAQVLGHDHGVTRALARASITMAKVDLWHARLAVKTLRRDEREGSTIPWRSTLQNAASLPPEPIPRHNRILP